MEKTEDVVSIGDVVPVKILSVDPEAQRMSLSIRQAKPKEKKPEQEKERPPKKKENVEHNGSYTEDEEGGITIGDLIDKDIFDNIEE